MKYNRYIQVASKAWSKRLFSPAIFFVLFTLATLYGYFFLTSQAPVKISTQAPPATKQAAPAKTEHVPAPPKVEYTSHKSIIHTGDTITRLLGDQLQPQEILSMVAVCKKTFPLHKIAVGHPYTIIKKDGEFHKLVYEIDADEQLVVCKQGDAFTSQTVPIEYEVRPSVVDGTINSSLFAAVTHAGEDASLAYRLADMFAWDIDFIRDIREGDKFRVLVEKRYREGEFAGYGHIKAAEFINQGHPHRGFLFKDAEGRFFHYDENGKSLRKAFLKAPLNFRRISSKYTLRRLHPIYKVYRPHQGIDYAAALGTPVWAVGDGTVFHVGWKGAAGRMIKVRHGGKYETYYLHLRRYAKGIKVGAKVRQGQVIGYVGSSGASTGPHLDFRMKKNGKYVNPMKVRTPSARAISKERMPEFRARTQKFLASLNAMTAPQTAHSNVTPPGGTKKTM